MDKQTDFVNYYGTLQVHPNCDARVLEIAFHHHAKMYHPDNAETADTDKFNEIMEAYSVLKDPKKRKDYDLQYSKQIGVEPQDIPSDIDDGIDEKTAINDAEMHNKILLHLYRRRREHPKDVGAIAWSLQEKLKCTDDEFEFYVWYLKSKGFIDITEQGTLAVTIAGVDYVISNCRTNLTEKLLIAKLDGLDG